MELDIRLDCASPGDCMEVRMSREQKNEGEGNRTAAKEYNKATTEFAQSGKVEPAAEKAKRAVDSTEGADLRRAEEKGRARGDSPGSQQRPQQRRGR
jgi:hypothetical protein